MEPLIITDPAEVANLEPGVSYILDVGFNEPDHDVEAFAAAYAEATAKAEAAGAKDEPTKDDDDPLEPIRGMTAVEIDKAMNKAPMIDMIEAASGERLPQRTKAADLAQRLFELAAV